jgi:hypothetical protein
MFVFKYRQTEHMRLLKKGLALLSFLGLMITANAQSQEALIGQWEGKYEENGEVIYITYQFKKEGNQLKCYTMSIKDDRGEEGAYTDLVMEDIVFKDGKGKAKYLYSEDDENYTLKAKLYLKTDHTLHISYSYWGFSDTEVWKRLE